MVCIALMPAHNEAPTIRALAEEALRYVDSLVVVDDGSTDGTSDALDGLPVRIIRHEQNGGKGRRLAQAFDLLFDEDVDQIVTLDADNQHDPADIAKFRAAAATAPQALLLGDRSAEMDRMPKTRARSIRFGNFFISWACNSRVPDAQCGMRLYPRSAWLALRDGLSERDRSGFVFETAVLLHAAEAGVPFVSVPVPARYAGYVQRPSHYRPISDTLRITSVITRFLLSRKLSLRRNLIA